MWCGVSECVCGKYGVCVLVETIIKEPRESLSKRTKVAAFIGSTGPRCSR